MSIIFILICTHYLGLSAKVFATRRIGKNQKNNIFSSVVRQLHGEHDSRDNIDSHEPVLRSQDTTGHCPDNNHKSCFGPTRYIWICVKI